MSLRRTGAFIAFAAAAMLVASSAWAHHNMSALFDFNDRVTLTGTLTKVDWRNPHIELVVDTKSGGIRWKPGHSKGRRPASSGPAMSTRTTSRRPSAKA